MPPVATFVIAHRWNNLLVAVTKQFQTQAQSVRAAGGRAGPRALARRFNFIAALQNKELKQTRGREEH